MNDNNTNSSIISTKAIVNLVDALFETDLHKLRRSFECEDPKGVTIETFVWILATTVPQLKTVISTFSEKHESNDGRRKRIFLQLQQQHGHGSDEQHFTQSVMLNRNNNNNKETTTATTNANSSLRKVDMAKIIASSSANKAPTLLLGLHPSSSSSSASPSYQQQQQRANKQRSISPLPYITTEPTTFHWSNQEYEHGKRLRANLEGLFIAMDVDGDGRVTWDELYSYTVNTTMQRLTVKPADVVRLYGVAKQVPRADNVVCVQHFAPLNAIGISSRHESIELLDATSLRVVARTSSKLSQFDRDALIKSASSASAGGTTGTSTTADSNELQEATQLISAGVSIFSDGVGGGGASSMNNNSTINSNQHHGLASSPTITKMCYVNSCNVIVAAADNLRMYCYSVMNGGDPAMIVKGKRIPGTQYRLNPICSEPLHHSVTQLRTAPSAPQLVFGSLTSGELSCYEVFDTYRPRLRYKFPLHAPGTIVSDFCFMSPLDHKIVSTAYDKTVRITDLHLQGEGHEDCHWVVGEPEHACTQVTYAASHELIVTASVDHQVRAWTAHSTRTPATLLFDSTNPHQSKIVGLFQIENTPQLISCDEGGLVKVWDLRNFRCAQSLVVGAKQTEVVDEAEIHATGGISRTSMAEMLGEQQIHRNLALNDICYIHGKQSFCCVGPSKVSLHKYDAGANPNLATESFILGARILADQSSIVMATPQELVGWDVESGSISMSLSDPTWEKDDFSCIVCDSSDRRVLAGTRSGKILMWSAVGLNRIQSHAICPHSSRSRTHARSSSSSSSKINNNNNNNNNKSRSSSPTVNSSNNNKKKQIKQSQQQNNAHHHTHNKTTGNSDDPASHHHTAVGVTGIGFCAAQNTIVSIGTDGFMQIQRLESTSASALNASRYLIGGGTPLCCLSVSDACATVAFGDDNGNLFICDAFVLSGQPVLFRTQLSAPIVSTEFCGNFPMVAVATADGWCSIFTCRPAPDGILLAKWRLDNTSTTTPSSKSHTSSSVARTVRQNMAAVTTTGGFDEFLEKNRAALNSEADAVHATCMSFDSVTHRLLAGTNSGEVFVWSLCELIVHYQPSLVSTSYVSLGAFLSYKWNPYCNRKRIRGKNHVKRKKKNEMGELSSPSSPSSSGVDDDDDNDNNDENDDGEIRKPPLLLREVLHSKDPDSLMKTSAGNHRISKKRHSSSSSSSSQHDEDYEAIISIDCATLSNGESLLVTCGETDRRCVVSRIRETVFGKSTNSSSSSSRRHATLSSSSSSSSSFSLSLVECGDLAYGRPSAPDSTNNINTTTTSTSSTNDRVEDRNNNNKNDNDNKDDSTARKPGTSSNKQQREKDSANAATAGDSTYVGGEKISEYNWTLPEGQKDYYNDEQQTKTSQKNGDGTIVSLVKLHELAEQEQCSLKPGKSCHHLPSPYQTKKRYLDRDDSSSVCSDDDDVDGSSTPHPHFPPIAGVVLGDFIGLPSSSHRRQSKRKTRPQREGADDDGHNNTFEQEEEDDDDEDSDSQQPTANNRTSSTTTTGISAYRVMHPDPARELTEEENERARRLAMESRFQRALRLAGEKQQQQQEPDHQNQNSSSTQDEEEEANRTSGNNRNNIPRPPLAPQRRVLQSRVAVSSAPGSTARRHHNMNFHQHQNNNSNAENIGDEQQQQSSSSSTVGGVSSRPRSSLNRISSRPQSSSKSSATHQMNHRHQLEDDDDEYDYDMHFYQRRDDDNDVNDDDNNKRAMTMMKTMTQHDSFLDSLIDVDVSTLTEQQLFEQKLHYQHRLREMSRNSKLSDKQIQMMNQRGVEALEAHAKELREREAELERQQAERNRHEAEVASVAATIATTRDLTREDKDVAESLPGDLSLSSLLIAAAHERRRLASAQRLPPLFLGVHKDQFVKADLERKGTTTKNSTTNARRARSASILSNGNPAFNPMKGLVCGDAMMCGVEHRPRTGSKTRPESARTTTITVTTPTSTAHAARTARTHQHHNNNNFVVETPFEEETPINLRFAGLRLGTNVVRPSSSPAAAQRQQQHVHQHPQNHHYHRRFIEKEREERRKRAISPPQTAGVASIGRDGAMSSTTIVTRENNNDNNNVNGRPSSQKKMTLSEKREKKIEDYGKQLKSCLRWPTGKAQGMPMDKNILKKQAMLEYNLGL